MRHPDVIVRGVARLLLTPSVVVAVALVAKGYAEVGDGFSAGMIIALTIALQYVALGTSAAERALPLLRFSPALVLGGLLLALATAFFPLALGEPPLSHRPGPGESVTTVGTLELFTPLAYDVAILLLVVGVLTTMLHLLANAELLKDEEVR
ncbi:MnhB domain-containing protein [Saccharomonospora cyanea]|uniref:MnhB domain-containing protein n=1 Tax=Saccharomonospora cyanea TaxID=40989 RepID=UPI0002DD7E33|nr:MnhB domain-containing protein [Saccharomonospora cyanea]